MARMIRDLPADPPIITTRMESGPIEHAYAPPGDGAPDMRTDGPRERRFNTVRVTAWAYAVYWAIFVPAIAVDSARVLPPGGLAAYLVVSAACALAAWSATHRRRVGYYFCLAFSAIIIVLPPIGTVLGWNMLRALRLNRDQFGFRT